MKSPRKEMQELITEYNQIKDQLLDFTDTYHDAMCYDIDGYCEHVAQGDYDELEALRCQIVAVRMLLKAHKNLKYIFC
jgi:hypothetical protein